MNDPALLLGLLAAAVLGVALLQTLIARPMVGVWLVLAYPVIQIALDESFGLSVGSVAIGLSDLSAILIMAAAILRLLRQPQTSIGQRLLLALTAVVVFGLVRGVASFGIQTAANEFREFLSFLSAAIYISTFPGEKLRTSIAKAWKLVAMILLAICILRWANKLAGVPIGPFALGGRSETMVFGQGDSLRVIHAGDTLILLQALLIVGTAWAAGLQRDRISAPASRVPLAGNASTVWFLGALLLSILLLQHRTIWVTTMVSGIVVIILLRDRQMATRVAALVVVLVSLVSAAAVVNTGGERLPEPIGDQLSDSATNENTFVWRFEGWVQLAGGGGNASVTDVLLGHPFGSGYERRLNGQTVEVNPHSTYLSFFLRSGIIGLLLLLAVYSHVLLALRRSRSVGLGIPQAVLIGILVSQLVFGLTYNPFTEQGLLLGLAIGAARLGTMSGTTQKNPKQTSGPSVVVGADVPADYQLMYDGLPSGTKKPQPEVGPQTYGSG